MTDQQRYGVGAAIESINAVGTDIAGGGADEVYTFTRAVAYCKIHLKTAGGQALYVKWNADAASATDWDEAVAAGATIVNPPGIHVQKVAIYSAGAYTKDTHFTVRGYV
jgi:hypothetical protein